MTNGSGARTVTAYLCVRGANEAITWYEKAFGAKELYRIPNPDGRVGHAELQIGASVIMLSDEWPEMGVVSPATLEGTATSFVLDVDDSDAVFNGALTAGATVERPLKDEPYGRGGWIVDPFGHRWSIMTSNPDFKPEDMQ